MTTVPVPAIRTRTAARRTRVRWPRVILHAFLIVLSLGGTVAAVVLP